VLFEPARELVPGSGQNGRAAPQQGRDHLDGMGAGHDGLDRVDGAVDAAGHGKRHADLPREDRDPPQAQQELGRIGESRARNDLEALDVDVRLVEAVEEDEAVGARALEPRREVRERGVEGRKLDGERKGDGLAHRRDDVHDAAFHVFAGFAGIGREIVDVELEGVRAGLRDQARVLDPRLGRRPVERCDDGDRDRGLDPLDLLQVFGGPEREEGGFGQIRQRLGVRLARGLVRVVRGELVPHDLLLEERPQDDRGGAGVLEAANGVEVVGERRRTRHEGVRKVEPEVGRREVHGHFAATADGAFHSDRCL